MLSKDHKKLLRQLKLLWIEKTAPGFYELSGKDQMKIKPYDDRTANGLQRCIRDFVTHQNGYCNRISTTGTMRKIRGQMKYTHGTGNKGAADLRILFKGMSFDVEVKIKDQQSERQKKEQQRIIVAGGTYVVCRSFEQFLRYWKEWGFEIPAIDKRQTTLLV